MLSGFTVFLVFVALAADGYFEPAPRYVYEYYTVNASGIKELVFFHTFDTNPHNTTQGIANISLPGLQVFYNMTRVIPPGSMANATELFFVTPTVPGLAIVLLGLCFIGQLAFTIKGIVDNCRIVGLSKLAVFRMVFFTYGQGLVQLLLQFGCYAAIAFAPDTELYLQLYFLFAMALVFAMKNLSPLIAKLACDAGDAMVSDIEVVLLMPHGVASFFGIIQVPLIIAKLGGTYDQPWAVALVPTFMALTVNTIGWLIFLCMVMRDDDDDENMPIFTVLASFVTYEAYNIALFVALTLFCFNDSASYYGQSEWPWTWLQVVSPLLAAFAFLILLQIFQGLGLLFEKLGLQCRQCHASVQKRQKEVDEHTRRSYADPTAMPLHIESPANESDGPADGASSLAKWNAQQQQFIARVASSSATDEMTLLSVLNDLSAALDQNEELICSKMRLLVVHRFAMLHESCGKDVWTEQVAAGYAALLRRFTAANTLLSKLPGLGIMRKLRMQRKPPAPPLST